MSVDDVTAVHGSLSSHSLGSFQIHLVLVEQLREWEPEANYYYA